MVHFVDFDSEPTNCTVVQGTLLPFVENTSRKFVQRCGKVLKRQKSIALQGNKLYMCARSQGEVCYK
jgi:hypothetical protein